MLFHCDTMGVANMLLFENRILLCKFLLIFCLGCNLVRCRSPRSCFDDSNFWHLLNWYTRPQFFALSIVVLADQKPGSKASSSVLLMPSLNKFYIGAIPAWLSTLTYKNCKYERDRTHCGIYIDFVSLSLS